MSCRFCGAGAGVFGVEMFLLPNGRLLLNEVAPRPHNSGHFTIEACATSQYAQHLRAVLGWPLGAPGLAVGCRCRARFCRGDVHHADRAMSAASSFWSAPIWVPQVGS